MALFSGSDMKEPLMERHTQEALAKRGAETVGFLLFLAAGLLAVLLGTYSPNDPGFFNATDAAPQNMMGLPGAMLADIALHFIGWAAWGVPLMLVIWGLRFVLHWGEGRFVRRVLLIPFAIMLASVFASAHTPIEGWPHVFGLGGWFGDAVLGALLQAIPVELNISLVTVTLMLAAGLAVVFALAIGVTGAEAMLALALLARRGPGPAAPRLLPPTLPSAAPWRLSARPP